MTAPTTYTAFVAALAALTVTGVTRKFTEPPASIGTADLPAMFPNMPRGNEPTLTFQSAGGWPAMFCELVIAVEPFNQGTQAQNFALTLTVMDNLVAALRAADIGRSKLTWEIAYNPVEIAGTAYWAVIATIEGR